MLTPDLNPQAYNVSSMTNFVDNITKHNKLYMLVHGTLDDNVHFQQGMVLARVLERGDIQFKEIVRRTFILIIIIIYGTISYKLNIFFFSQTYPDEDHSLAGVRPHLYHSLERFFKECFNLSD